MSLIASRQAEKRASFCLLTGSNAHCTLFLTITLLILTGCGSRGEPPPPEVTPVSLTYFSLDSSLYAEDALIEQFEATAPHIKIERKRYENLPTQYLNNSPTPDVMLIGPTHMLLWSIRQGQLLDVTDIWSQAGLLDRYPPSLRALSEVNGKQYFVPTGFSWSGIYYNQKIFEQYGLEPPQYWDEFLLLADTLRANGVVPFAIAGDDPTLVALWFDYLNLRINGPDFHRNLMRGRESYQDSRVIEVFETWRWLFENEFFVERPSEMDGLESMSDIISDEKNMLTGQRAAMVLADPFALGELPEPWQAQPGFFSFPIIDPSLPVGEVVLSLGYMIPAKSEHPLEAIEFLTYISTPDAQILMHPPLTDSAAFAPVNVNSEEFSNKLRQRSDIVLKADVVDMPYFWGSPETIQFALGAGLTNFLRGIERSEVNIDMMLLALEEARLAAVQGGLFVE
ncbi:ABC transporter substrate-binding protein [Chloroflexi bacterium TSY]|nr:ABC transporter substrate-binding protein [Chloroflexi bacterium TSY]